MILNKINTILIFVILTARLMETHENDQHRQLVWSWKLFPRKNGSTVELNRNKALNNVSNELWNYIRSEKVDQRDINSNLTKNMETLLKQQLHIFVNNHHDYASDRKDTIAEDKEMIETYLKSLLKPNRQKRAKYDEQREAERRGQKYFQDKIFSEYQKGAENINQVMGANYGSFEADYDSSQYPHDSYEIPGTKRKTSGPDQFQDRSRRWQSSSNGQQAFNSINDEQSFPINLPETAKWILANNQAPETLPINNFKEDPRLGGRLKQQEPGMLSSHPEMMPAPFNSIADQKYLQQPGESSDHVEPALQSEEENVRGIESKDASWEQNDPSIDSEGHQTLDLNPRQFPLPFDTMKGHEFEPRSASDLRLDLKTDERLHRISGGQEKDNFWLGSKDISAPTRMTLDNTGVKKWSAERKKRETANDLHVDGKIFRDSSMQSNLIGGQDAGPTLYYQGTDSERPYYLYYPVVYVQGNQQKLHYVAIPNAKFQTYDPDTLSHVRRVVENIPAAKDNSFSSKSAEMISGSELGQESDKPGSYKTFLDSPDRGSLKAGHYEYPSNGQQQFNRYGDVRNEVSAMKDVGGAEWTPISKDERNFVVDSSYQVPRQKSVSDIRRVASVRGDFEEMEAVPWASTDQENNGNKAKLPNSLSYNNLSPQEYIHGYDGSNVRQSSSGSVKKSLNRHRKRDTVSQAQDLLHRLRDNTTLFDNLMEGISEILNIDSGHLIQFVSDAVARTRKVKGVNFGRQDTRNNVHQSINDEGKSNMTRSNAMSSTKCCSMLINLFESLAPAEHVGQVSRAAAKSDHLYVQNEN